MLSGSGEIWPIWVVRFKPFVFRAVVGTYYGLLSSIPPWSSSVSRRVGETAVTVERDTRTYAVGRLVGLRNNPILVVRGSTAAIVLGSQINSSLSDNAYTSRPSNDNSTQSFTIICTVSTHFPCHNYIRHSEYTILFCFFSNLSFAVLLTRGSNFQYRYLYWIRIFTGTYRSPTLLALKQYKSDSRFVARTV